jgi:predicted nucleic acid-binding protein
MKVAFDTSVLVPALVAPHPNHEASLRWIEACRRGRHEGTCSWHAAAETWAVLTRIPMDPGIPPVLATDAVERLMDVVKPVLLGADHYQTAMQRCAERSLRSGSLFDALHLVVAEKEGADALLTFNIRDFERMRLPTGPELVIPGRRP